jgi:hypothetical protein
VVAYLRLEQLAGTWVFDPDTSRLNSEAPGEWVQNVVIQGSRIHIREEIQRENNRILVEVDARVDGTFYPLTGTIIADEKAYRLSGDALEGVGRCNGAPAFRERMSINADGELVLELYFQAGKRELPVGSAHFKLQT